MKKNKKKILAGACLGLVGIGCLTGCSVDLTDAQKDKIMTVVDNSDAFMDETLSLLQEQNSQLDRTNAFKLYELATRRIAYCTQNSLENLKINVSCEYDMAIDGLDEKFSINYFKDSNGKYYHYVQNEDKEVVTMYYADGLNDTITLVKGYSEIFSGKSYASCVNTSPAMTGLIFLMGGQTLPNENCVYYGEKLENGNYYVVLSSEGTNYFSLIYVEITPNGDFVSATVDMKSTNGGVTELHTMRFDFQYDKLVENDVLSLVESVSNS